LDDGAVRARELCDHPWHDRRLRQLRLDHSDDPPLFPDPMRRSRIFLRQQTA
jgi:hypothetical protein